MSKSPTFIVLPPERRGRECPSILDYIFSKASSFLKFVHTDPFKENACSDACTGDNESTSPSTRRRKLTRGLILFYEAL